MDAAPARHTAMDTAKMALAPRLDLDQPQSFCVPSNSSTLGLQGMVQGKWLRLTCPSDPNSGTVSLFYHDISSMKRMVQIAVFAHAFFQVLVPYVTVKEQEN